MSNLMLTVALGMKGKVMKFINAEEEKLISLLQLY